MGDALLVGANLAALVAARELATAGVPVTLLTDGRPVGGHFGGLVADGVAFDIGMVTLERPAPGTGPVPPLRDHDPDRRYDWTRFGALVDRWQAGRAELRRTPTPEVVVGGRRWPDHLMTDRLEVLAGAAAPGPGPDRLDPRHAAHKVTGAAYATLTYREAALVNHGPDVQDRLVEPFLQKVLGPDRDLLLARHHRAAWLPLYWPATVAAASRSEPTAVAEHPFWTTADGLVAELVTGLRAELAADPLVVVDDGPVRSVHRSAGELDVRTDRGSSRHPTPVLGLPADRARELLGLPAPAPAPAAPVAVLCCLVRAGAIGDPAGCLLVVDPGVVAYRVTDQDAQAGRDPAWHRVTVEAGHAGHLLAGAGSDLARRLVEELVGLLGLPGGDPGPGGTGHPDVRVLRLLRAPRALPVPTAGSVAADRGTREELLAAGVVPTGGLLGTGLGSLADQVLQGLAVAERFG